MKEIIFLILFIWFKKIYFWFKYTIDKNVRNNIFNFVTLNKENLFFKLKKIFLWITLHVYYATAQKFISLIQRKNKETKNFSNSKKLFFERIAMHQFVWFKEIVFESKKLFSGCASLGWKFKKINFIAEILNIENFCVRWISTRNEISIWNLGKFNKRQ